MKEMLKAEKLLRQEEEFLKANEEINLKTKDLLREVEHLKEISSNTEKICRSWQVPDTAAVNEVVASSPKSESFDKTFDLVEYMENMRLENGGSTNSNESIKGERTQASGDSVPSRHEFRYRRKQSQSAKSYAVSTTDLGLQAEFPFETARPDSEDKSKRSKDVYDDVIPESVKGIGQEGLVRFLTAKVKALADQLQAVQKEEKKHVEKIKDLQVQKEKLVEERDRLTQQVNTAKNVLVKYEQHSKTVNTQLQTTQAENGNLKKELESARKEMRQNKQSFNANELKLNRTLEEVDKLKSTIQQMKQQEKESKEFSRKRIEDLTNTVKKLDKQRIELLNGFKKQLIVIDNLKKQKGLVEAAKLLKSAEDDFMNFLDCNPPNVVNSRVNSHR